MKVEIVPLTRKLCHAMYRVFDYDPAVFAENYHHYEYDAAKVDAYFDERGHDPARRVFAILADGVPVGEVQLKYIDFDRQECSMGIHLTNDSVKEKGIGTQAEKLALAYAFNTLHMRAVNADAIHKNARSQHVLEKVGFVHTHDDAMVKYYRIENPA